VSWLNRDATGLDSTGVGGCSAGGGGDADLVETGAVASVAACSRASFVTSGSVALGDVSAAGLCSSFLVNKGFGANAGVGLGDASLTVSIFLGSADSSFLGDSGLRRPTGFNCMSFIGDVRPDPVGSPNELPLPRSTLLRCCLMRLISAIHAGCAGADCFGLGDSGLLSALSSQVDFVGLHRFEGLGGEKSSCSASLSLKVDATDLALL